MIKNKAIKKDPEKLEAYKLTQGSNRGGAAGALGKLNKIVKSRTVDVWPSMTVTDLSQQLNITVDDVFEQVFKMPMNTDWLQDEHQPIRSMKLVSFLGGQLHFSLNVVHDPDTDKKEKVVIDRCVKVAFGFSAFDKL